MPPKGSGNLLREEDFIFNTDRTRVECRACSTGVPPALRTSIAVLSAIKHLRSPDHSKALARLAEAKSQAERIQNESRAESAAPRLPESLFAAPAPLLGPITARGSQVQSLEEMDMWDQYKTAGANFDAGDDKMDVGVEHDRLRKEVDTFGMMNAEAMAKRLGFGMGSVAEDILDDEEEEDFLSELIGKAGLGDPDLADIQRDGQSPILPRSEWFPYPSQMIFLLDILDNLPRLRISNSLMRVFLWILKEAQCKDVPSFDHLRRVQKQIRADSGIPSIPCKSPLGNVFFMNDPRAIIAQDWANPTTRKLIHVYPEIPEDGIIREIWHAEKWCKQMNLDSLSPMYNAGASHYYVNEVALLKNGNFVIPVRWVKFRGKIYADAFKITFDDASQATVMDDATILVAAADLSNNYLDLQDQHKVPTWSTSTIDAGHPERMPNLKRAIAGGHPLYHSFVDYFGDDVSGNRSKSWNKHWNAYMTHRNLPRTLLQQEFHVHFVSTSPNASITEQYREFKTAVESTHTDPVQVQDESGDTTCFCMYVNAGPSDNPMQSEVSGHIGGKGNRFCRKCEAGVPRTKQKIMDELQKQVKLACSGVAKPIKDSQTQTGVKDMYTQHWIDHLLSRFKEMKADQPERSNEDIETELIQWTVDNRDQIYSAFLTTDGFDPTKDTPVEILHTILLGVVKYIWHISHTPWTPEKKKLYSLRLQSTATDGLSIHAIRANYIMQYAGSLIGRQFKTLAQTNIFHVRGLVTDHQFMAWKATGELSALLWVPEIRDLAEYRRDLKVAVANVLDIFSLIDPSKMITKIKLHLLAHIDDDAVGFGPLVGVGTEIFECFNAIFRYCSILSNHLAPSRDIAQQLGDQEGLKHRLTGGWWLCHAGNEWLRAGAGVRHFMADHPVLQRLLGWAEQKLLKHGETKLQPLQRGQKHRLNPALKSTMAARAVNYGMYSPESAWLRCSSLVAESLDECYAGSWIFARSATDANSTITGRISEILTDNATVLVILEQFQVLSVRDDIYGMPVLVRRHGETSFTIITAKDTKFKVNVQHDCYLAKCEATGQRLRMQERVESDQIENFIVHEPVDRFIINTHAFHNAHLLRATLPRDLIAPIPLFENRKEKHDEFATTLRATVASKVAKRRAAAVDGAKAAPAKRKRGKNQALAPSKRRKRVAQPLPEPLEQNVEVGLVAGRPKRAVQPSKRAVDAAAAEAEAAAVAAAVAAAGDDKTEKQSEDEYELSESDSDGGDMYNESDVSD
ncbi:hypothetical protein DFH06DRAFT_1336620 [Mycena polygramma]|nr:hypothetical protein DFH06DRAFT_1336620 [Mycena polygramma]